MNKLFVMCLLLISSQVLFAQNIKVLILDGVSTHNWRATTKDTKDTLLKTGKFVVDVNTSPSRKASKEEWAKWLPNFSNYAVVVSHINDRGKTLWHEKTRNAFSEYVKNGGGLVIVHSANNSSNDWPAYNKMIAVGGWGGRKAGTSGYLLRKYQGEWSKGSPDSGLSGGHGPQREFLITIDKPEHPIVKGLPTKWMHSKDELYHSLRGPAENVEVIGSSYAIETKQSEPMMMVVKYGKGIVFHTPMGHYNEFSTKCLGFQTIFARGTEFVATGKVTIGMPEDFPTVDKAKHKDPNKVVWKH